MSTGGAYDGLPVVEMSTEDFWREPALTARAAARVRRPRSRSCPVSTRSCCCGTDDCYDALVDPAAAAATSVRRYFELQGWTGGPWVEWTRRNVVMVDPPVHTRLRSLVNRAFTPRRVEEVHETTLKIAHELSDAAADAGHASSSCTTGRGCCRCG